jgi:hypothetical protein
MKFDPKLKNAMKDIKAILDKYDINGSIVLHSPGFGEHFMKVDASYSCAKIEPSPQGLQFKIKAKKEELQKIEDTVNTIIIIDDLISYHQDVCLQVMKSVKQTLEIDAQKGDHTNDQELFN